MSPTGFAIRRFAILALAAAGMSPADAAPRNRCAELHKDYKIATAKVADALQKYADCLDNGDATQACSSQYGHLRSAHRLLEISTYNFSRYCRATDRGGSDRY